MKTMYKEFKEFALRGNVIDLAVGIIIGAAFNSIVRSFVDDILMPPIGYWLGGVDFTNLFYVVGGEEFESLEQATAAGAATVNYGLFVNALVSFIITAFAVFILIRFINKTKRKEQEEPEVEPTTKECPYCFETIAVKALRCPRCTSSLKAEAV